MKIIVADKKEYENYFSKKSLKLDIEELNNQKDYVIHSIFFETGENDVSLMYVSINKLLAQQYERNSYVRLEELKELDKLFHTLDKEQCKIINAYAEVKEYTINSLDEIKELITNINDYQIIEKYNLEEIGKLIVEKVADYDGLDEILEFIDYEKLAERYLFDSNIKENFCSYGLLVNTRYMLENEIVKEKITEDKVLEIEVVNKKQYDETYNCSRVIVCLPIDDERLKEKLELLNLKYDELEMDDTHITFCRLVNFNNEKLSDGFDFEIEKIIYKVSEKLGKTISLNAMIELSNEITKFNNIEIRKFVSVLEAKENIISDFDQVVEYAKNIRQYEVIPDITNHEEMGKYLVNETGHFDDVSTLDDYINYEKLSKDYTEKGYTYAGDFTRYGFLIKKEELEMINASDSKEDEEFE